jgi:hypothetical protein
MPEDAATRASAAAEHEGFADRDHADANAPGSPAGSGQHTNLAMMRDATYATTSAASRREPETYEARISSDLPDASCRPRRSL